MSIIPLEEHELKIIDSCESIFDDVISFTEEMVKQYSVLNNEQGVLNVVERQLNELNLPVKKVPINQEELSKSPLFADVDWGYDNKYNLVSVLNHGEEGKTLVLNGHLDVVPAEPIEMWTRPPSEPWQKDGWLYGRGSGDMQSGVAAMIYAVHAIEKSGFEIKSPLTIQAVVEEECTGNGAIACLENGYGGDFVLIPEPFGPYIYGGQIGVLWFKIGVEGVPAHVLDTSAGEDAIFRLQSFIPYLQKLEAELNDKFNQSGPYSDMKHPYNLNVGIINGGNWASSVAAYAEMDCRIGFPPGMPINQIMQMVRAYVEEAYKANKKGKKPTLQFNGFRSEGHLVDLDHSGIQLLSNCHRSITDSDPEISYLTCTTDLRAFHCHSKINGTCYGPVAQRIHGVDECVNIESIKHVLKTYALFISRYCKLEPK